MIYWHGPCFADVLQLFSAPCWAGLWADDFVGAGFWGWDPKENGALIIVLWNALVLHARWGGMIPRPRPGRAGDGRKTSSPPGAGSAVNELGAGLHSYGFNRRGRPHAWALPSLLQLGLIGAGILFKGQGSAPVRRSDRSPANETSVSRRPEKKSAGRILTFGSAVSLR